MVKEVQKRAAYEQRYWFRGRSLITKALTVNFD
jgi:hypothetical protein